LIFDRLSDLLERLGSYPVWEIGTELLLIWIVVFALVRFIQGTRAAGVLKGLLLVLVICTLTVRLMSAGDSFQRLAFLFDRLLAFFAIVMVVVFAPELRRAFSRLGEARLGGTGGARSLGSVVDHVAEASIYLSRQRFGALIVLERRVGLRGLIQGGTTLDSEVSTPLLQTIFFPGSALHDLAVIIRGKRVVAAGVQLPLADAADMPDPMLGSRHRAAVGLSKETDSLVVIVSEETGAMRISERGRLSRAYQEDELAGEIRRRLGSVAEPDRRLDEDKDESALDDELSSSGAQA